MSCVRHPNVVPVCCDGTQSEPPYYDMPIAERTLRDQFDRDRRFGASSLLPVLDLLAGVEALHACGITHKDIKPENLLLVGEEWCVADFGLASGRDSHGMTSSAGARGAGTPGYMAPEQFESLHRADSQSDIYSIGCVLHDIATNCELRVPYRQYSASGPLGKVVERATAIEPCDRFGAVSELRDALALTLDLPSQVRATSDVLEIISDQRRVGGDDPLLLGRKLVSALTASSPSMQMLHLALIPSEVQLERLRKSNGGIWDQLAFGTLRYARECAAARSIDVDRLVSRLRYFSSMGDPKVSAAAITTLFVIGARVHRPSVGWWIGYLLSTASDAVIGRLQIALPALAIRSPSIAVVAENVGSFGHRLDSRLVELLATRRSSEAA